VFEVATRQPESIAIKSSDGETITYARLLHESKRIAQALLIAGAKPTNLIGILTAPGVEMVATMMAAINIRCGYVPLDPDFAPGRLAHMIDDSSISILVYGVENSAQISSLRHLSNPVMLSLSSVTSAQPQAIPALHAEPSDPLYVIYTSVRGQRSIINDD
jgi:non-ribosomal peptide synthetase component F